MREMPKKGEVETLFERLSEYIIPVDYEWKNQIFPASEDDINKLLKISRIRETNFRVPKEYLCYLKTMGENDGGIISWMLKAKTDIKTLLNLYNTKEKDILDPIEPNHLIIAYNDEVGLEYYINILNERQYIISTEESLDKELEELNKCSEDFEKLLFQSAVKKYEQKYLTFSNYFGNNRLEYKKILDELCLEDIFIEIDKIAQKYNCKKMWFSDKWNYIASNSELSFWVKRDYVLSGGVFGNDDKDVENITRELKKIFGIIKV